MKFSVWPNMSHAPSEVFDTARWAEDTNWHGIWYADHYMPNTGDESITPGDTHECWAMLPAIAALTDRLRVGTLVSPTSVHHPAVLANRAASIDHISNGRMVLGLGAGWQINEHRAYGIELEPAKERVDRFEEAIQIIRSLMGQDRTTFDGDVYSILDATSDPAPIQSPLPILVGTGGKRMLKITARFADEWNTWGGPDMAGGAHTRFEPPASRWASTPAASGRRCRRSCSSPMTTPGPSRSSAGDMGYPIDRRHPRPVGRHVGAVRRTGLRRVHRARLQPGHDSAGPHANPSNESTSRSSPN